jgi:replicative DNA helicase
MLLEEKTIENILDSISFSEKFKQYREFLDFKIHEELSSTDVDDIIKQVRLRKKVNTLFENYDQLNNVLSQIKDGSFDSLDDLVDDYESTIKILYTNMMESNRAVLIEEASSLDLVKDNYERAISMIKEKYDKTNKTSTGFPFFDNDILYGGFDKSRLYVFGGGSGSGKSTMLNNLITRSATSGSIYLEGKQNLKDIERVYIYITLENTIEEALLRTYMPMFNASLRDVLKEISTDEKAFEHMKAKILEELAKNRSTIIMKYFPAMSISAVDIMGIVDDVISEYGKDVIKGLYIDYLDLLKTDTKYDLYRMELGHITLSLKSLAVEYNIPVITATQLGRSAYKIRDSKELGVEQIGESIKKVEHADFVALLGKDPTDQSLVHGKIGKNRAGRANVAVDFKVDFSMYKFISAMAASEKEKQDGASQTSDFHGLMSV